MRGAWLESWFGFQSDWSHSTGERSWSCSTPGRGHCAPPLLPGEDATLHPDHAGGGLGSVEMKIHVFCEQNSAYVNTGVIQPKARISELLH